MEHFIELYLLVGNELRDVLRSLDKLPQSVDVFLLQILAIEGFLVDDKIDTGFIKERVLTW